MTIINGIEWGVEHDIIRLKESFAASSPLSTSRYTFNDFSCFGKNGTRQGVLAIVLRIRGDTYSVPTVASTFWDGVTGAQILDKVSMKLADNSPPARFDGGDTIIMANDNYRVLQGLSWLSHKPAVLMMSQGNERYGLTGVPTGAAPVQPDKVIATLQGTRTRGWLQNCGPYFATGTDPSTVSKDIVLIYWVGVQAGEAMGSCAIPANWFTGDREGCDKTGAGYFEFSLNTKIDDQTITWDPSVNVDLYALVSSYNLGDQPIPATPKLRFYNTSESTFKVPSAGVPKFLAFMPPLTSGGDMQTTDYRRVELRVGDTIYVESQQDLNLLSQTLMGNYNDERFFDMPMIDDLITERQASRLTRGFHPLLAYPDSNLHSVGDINDKTRVTIIEAGTTTHNLFQVNLNPVTADVRAAAIEWAAGNNLSVASSTSNGNQPEGFTGKAQALPAVAEVPAPVMMSMKAK